METKRLIQSKTFWTNIIALVAMIVASQGVDIGLDVETQGTLVAGILAVTNIALRVVTHQRVTLK